MLSKKLAGYRTALLLTASLVLLGCAKGDARNKVVKATGRVLLGGEPLTFGEVIFQPIQGGQPAKGEIGPDGEFSLSTYNEGDGAAVGRHKVRVVQYDSQSHKHDAAPVGDSLGELLTPARYASFATSGLEVSVLAGGSAPFLIELEPELDEPSSDEESQADSDSEAPEETNPSTEEESL